jgi:hypothetical protein
MKRISSAHGLQFTSNSIEFKFEQAVGSTQIDSRLPRISTDGAASPHITQLDKRDDGEWLHREYNDLNDVVKLTSVDYEFSLSEVYQNVSFKPRPTPLDE